MEFVIFSYVLLKYKITRSSDNCERDPCFTTQSCDNIYLHVFDNMHIICLTQEKHGFTESYRELKLKLTICVNVFSPSARTHNK